MIIGLLLIEDEKITQKDISYYFNRHGFVSSSEVSLALSKQKPKYDFRKTTNMMDRLRDHCILRNGLALLVKRNDLFRYWYPKPLINTFLKFLGFYEISFDESKFGEFSKKWVIDRLTNPDIAFSEIKKENFQEKHFRKNIG